MATFEQTLNQKSASERAQLAKAANVQTQILKAYTQAHDDITVEITKMLKATAPTKGAYLALIRSSQLRNAIISRTFKLSTTVTKTLVAAAPNLAQIVEKQTAREAKQLAGVTLVGVDHRLIEKSLADAAVRISGWNGQYSTDIIRSLRVGALKAKAMTSSQPVSAQQLIYLRVEQLLLV